MMNEEGFEMVATDPVDSVAYRWFYCNACRIRHRKVKEAVTNLRDTIALLGIENSVPELAIWELGLKRYDEFNRVLDGVVKIFGCCTRAD
jgi:hypothetical protein